MTRAWGRLSDQRPPAQMKTGPTAPFLYALASTQTEKLDPQPQVVVAFGFLITNWAPSRLS